MHPTKNTLPEDTRRAVISLLQDRLADTLDLASQAKQAHWNVKGMNFIALHELFDSLHGEMIEFSDTIAERLVSLGGQAYGTVREAAKRSSLTEYPVEASKSEDHIEAVSSALASLGTSLRDAIDAADQAGDQDSADLFTEVSRGVDKMLWFVEAHSH